jgi:signal peptidase I
MGASFFDLEQPLWLPRLPRVSVDRPPANGTGSVVGGNPVVRSRLRLLNVLVLSVVAVVSAGMVSSAVGLWRAEVVLSGSMRPRIPPGSIEIFLPESTNGLRVGQVVAFHPPNKTFVVTHRVIGITKDHGVWITTKGDANRTADPWGKVHLEGGSVWVVHSVVPGLGFVTAWAKSPWPRLVVLVTALVLAGWLALQRIWRS